MKIEIMRVLFDHLCHKYDKLNITLTMSHIIIFYVKLHQFQIEYYKDSVVTIYSNSCCNTHFLDISVYDNNLLSKIENLIEKERCYNTNVTRVTNVG